MTFRYATLSDLLQNNVVFRELNPLNSSLPNFEALKKELNLQSLPRKKDKEYAKVLYRILKSAKDFSNIVYIGDTFLSDLTVIKNLKEYANEPVFGVITSEGTPLPENHDTFVVFNDKWANLPALVEDKIGGNSLVVIDLDKTFIGANGRNHLPIDKARTDAIVALGKNIFEAPNRGEFLNLYQKIHSKEFLAFTEDNQDIVSILTLIIYSSVVSFEEFARFTKTGTFEEFINKIDVKEPLLTYVDEVRNNLKLNMPTLFPTFRKIELEKTVGRMDFLPVDTPLDALLSEEILITGEVYEVVDRALKKGATLFGVSDKPEIASFNDNISILSQRMKIYP